MQYFPCFFVHLSTDARAFLSDTGLTQGWEHAVSDFAPPEATWRKSWVQESMTSRIEWKIVIQVGGLDIYIYTTWKGSMAIAAPISRSFIMASWEWQLRHRSGLPNGVTFTCQKRHLGMGMTDSSDAEYDHVMVEITASLHDIIAALENPQLFWKQQLKGYRSFKIAWKDNDQNKRFTMQRKHPHH